MAVSRAQYAVFAAAAMVGMLAGRAAAAPDNWAVDASGLWTLGANWSAGVPGAASDVTIDRPAGDFLVTLDAGVQSINSLVTTERLTISAGTLTVATTMNVQNTFTMLGGTLAGGTLSTSGAGAVVLTSGVLDHVTLGSDLTMTAGQSATLANGLTLGGKVLSIAGAGGFPFLSFTGSQSIVGPGTLVLDGVSGFRGILGHNSTGTLTLGAGVLLKTGTGDSATIAEIRGPAFVNQGTISSQSAGKELLITTSSWTNSGVMETKTGGILTLGGVWSNTGTLTMNAGTLNLGGTVTTAGLGTFTRTGGAVRLTGTIDNTGNTLGLTAATGSFLMAGGTIKNGRITTTGGAQLVGGSGGTLDGVTLATDLTLTAGDNLVITNGLTLAGSTVSVVGNGGFPFLTYSGSQTIGGTGTITLDGSGGFRGILGHNSVGTMTLAPGILVKTGTGDSATIGEIRGPAFINQGTISSQTAGKELQITTTTWSNSGVVEAKNGGILTLTGAWANTGTLSLNAGTLNLGGAFSTAALNLGTFARAGGLVQVTGVLDNTGTTLPLTAATGSFVLANGSIKNGTITATGGAQLLAGTNAGTLDGVALGANFTLSAGQSVVLTNGLTLLGSTIAVTGTGGFPFVTYSGSQTIGGTGTITLDGSGGFRGILGHNSVGTMTLAPGILVTTGTGDSAFIAEVRGPAMVNQGTISSRASGKELQITTTTWSNTGVLEAKTGGILTLTGAWTNSGTLSLNAGTLNLGGTFSTASLVNLNRTGGEVRITGAMNNAGTTLPLTAATGSFVLMAGGTISGGTVTASGGAQLLAGTGGTLDGVTLATNFALTVNQNVTLTNGLTLQGAVVNLVGNGGFPFLSSQGSQTIGGSGSLVLDGSGGFYGVVGANSSGTLTLGPGILVKTGTGDSATLGAINSPGLINQGTIQIGTAGRTLQSNSAVFLNSGTLTGPGSVQFNGTNVTLNGVFNIGGTLTSNSGPLVFGGAAQSVGVITGNSDIAVNSTAGLTSDGVRGNSLTVNTTHTIRSNGTTNGTSRVNALTLAGNTGAWIGKLELNNTLMIVQANSSNKAAYLSAIRDQVVAGAGGTVGITSASALSDPVHKKTYVVDNGILGLSGWNGFGVNSTSILVGATYVGDANFDRVVNVTDLGVLATFYGQAVPNGLLQGDFNGDGVVNVTDLGMLATNYGSGTGGAAFSLEGDLAQFPVFGGASGVPEPASVAVLGAAALLLVKRRRGLRVR